MSRLYGEKKKKKDRGERTKTEEVFLQACLRKQNYRCVSNAGIHQFA